MLPNSTERAVTISGGSEAITQCIYNICNIMAEVSDEVTGLIISSPQSAPQSGMTVSYRPAALQPVHHNQLVLPATQASLLFQSSPKGPTIPYKPQQFTVPPPSPTSPSLSCQSDSSFVSPPPPGPPAPTGPPCPPGQPSLPMQLDSIQVLPPMFPQPMMAPQPLMAGSPCVRYTTIPCHQTMFSLALPDQPPVKPPGQLCGQLPEASRVLVIPIPSQWGHIPLLSSHIPLSSPG